VDPRADLDDVETILDPTGTRNSDPSVVQPVYTVAISTSSQGLLNVEGRTPQVQVTKADMTLFALKCISTSL
jgi:hypothetical protein